MANAPPASGIFSDTPMASFSIRRRATLPSCNISLAYEKAAARRESCASCMRVVTKGPKIAMPGELRDGVTRQGGSSAILPLLCGPSVDEKQPEDWGGT